MKLARLVVVAAVVASWLLAAESATSESVSKDGADLAIQGYDAVAYFTEGRPVRGQARFAFRWHDAKWLFSSAGHRDLFAGNPGRYAPRYGGFCAGGMSRGVKVRVDPEAWVIIDGKLYLNSAKSVAEEFARNADANIAAADRHWKRLGPPE